MLANVCGVQVEGGGHNAHQCVWGAGRGRGAQCSPMCVWLSPCLPSLCLIPPKVPHPLHEKQVWIQIQVPGYRENPIPASCLSHTTNGYLLPPPHQLPYGYLLPPPIS